MLTHFLPALFEHARHTVSPLRAESRSFPSKLQATEGIRSVDSRQIAHRHLDLFDQRFLYCEHVETFSASSLCGDGYAVVVGAWMQLENHPVSRGS